MPGGDAPPGEREPLGSPLGFRGERERACCPRPRARERARAAAGHPRRRACSPRADRVLMLCCRRVISARIPGRAARHRPTPAAHTLGKPVSAAGASRRRRARQDARRARLANRKARPGGSPTRGRCQRAAARSHAPPFRTPDGGSGVCGGGRAGRASASGRRHHGVAQSHLGLAIRGSRAGEAGGRRGGRGRGGASAVPAREVSPSLEVWARFSQGARRRRARHPGCAGRSRQLCAVHRVHPAGAAGRRRRRRRPWHLCARAAQRAGRSAGGAGT